MDIKDTTREVVSNWIDKNPGMVVFEYEEEELVQDLIKAFSLIKEEGVDSRLSKVKQSETTYIRRCF